MKKHFLLAVALVVTGALSAEDLILEECFDNL